MDQARSLERLARLFFLKFMRGELTQLVGGLFGALIVLPTGMTHRDTTERLLIITDNGLEPGSETGASRDSLAIVLRAGVTYRIRIISIGRRSGGVVQAGRMFPRIRLRFILPLLLGGCTNLGPNFTAPFWDGPKSWFSTAKPQPAPISVTRWPLSTSASTRSATTDSMPP